MLCQFSRPRKHQTRISTIALLVLAILFVLLAFAYVFNLIHSTDLKITDFVKTRIRTALLILLGTPIVFIGASRLYLLAHWTSDILGGYMFGGIALILTIRIDKHRRILKNAKNE